MERKLCIFYSNASQKPKDAPKLKKVTTKSKAVQTIQEEKEEIDVDDLISNTGKFKTILFHRFLLLFA